MENNISAELTKVSKRYGKTVALNELTLALRSGELLALLGANGAGKTTAVKLLLGLTAPDRGTARVFGANPRLAANRIRTGAMLQVAGLPDTLRVREYVEMFSGYYPRPLPLREVLEIAGLTSIEDRLFGKLSGGQKQRVLFALSICGDPDLLVLDEPTVGLDVESRRGLWEQIRRFVKRGKSILLTTHYLAEADALADRIAVIDRGSLIAEGTPAQIKSRAAGKRVRCSTRLTTDEIRAMAHVVSVTCDGSNVEITTPEGELVVRELLMRDPALTALEISSAALEDAFLSLTQSDAA